jgi:hypothetical protein
MNNIFDKLKARNDLELLRLKWKKAKVEGKTCDCHIIECQAKSLKIALGEL